MIHSVLVIQGERVSNEMQVLLESKIANVKIFHCHPDEIDDVDLDSYHLILIQDNSIALYLKDILHNQRLIFWYGLANLSYKLDIFLQLERHTQDFPLELDNWTLIEVLKSSDDSVVYKAENNLQHHFAAIKRFKYSPSILSSKTIDAVLSCAEKERKHCCPNGLVKFYEGGVSQQAFYLVMEYLGYGTLRQALNGCGNELPQTHALEWFQEIVVALSCVHKAGFVHRDLKIDNIMLRGDGSLVLMDYGISKRILLDTGFVFENELHCSPHYVSPEQITGDACTQASDIYSLGVIFYELLTGHKPYSARQAHELMMHHIMAPVPVFPEHLKQYQPLLDKMMAKNPEDRFKSAMDAIERLPLAA